MTHETDVLEKSEAAELNIQIDSWIGSLDIDMDEEDTLSIAINEVWALGMGRFTDWYEKHYPESIHKARKYLAGLASEFDCSISFIMSRLDAEHQRGGRNCVKAEFLTLLYDDHLVDDLSAAFDRFSISAADASSAELLLFAIDNSDQETVKYLVGNGVNSDLSDYANDIYHLTPMRLALRDCKMPIVRTLLEGGFDLPIILLYDEGNDSFDREGAFEGEIESAEWGRTALVSAYLFFRGHMNCLALYAPFDQKDSHGNNILHYLALDGVAELPQALTAPKGHQRIAAAALNEANKDGQTPLHIAISVENWALLAELIDYGPDLARPEFDNLAAAIEDENTPRDIIEALESIGLRY